MNLIADNIISFLGSGEDIIEHYGKGHLDGGHSGRYAWGSGDNPYQHSGEFLARVRDLESQGLSEKSIRESLGLSSPDFRTYKRYAIREAKLRENEKIWKLTEEGYNDTQIGKMMNLPESTIRSRKNQQRQLNLDEAGATANILRDSFASGKKVLDVGEGVERELGISKDKLNDAVFILENEGYHRYGIDIPQPTNPQQRTKFVVLAKEDVTYDQIYKNPGLIESWTDYYSDDNGKTFRVLRYPSSVDSKRVMVRYGDEGGVDKDGVIELRPGVADLDLGKSHYAQVRILVDGTHYLKGMAVYANDLPDGVDIRFNTNKPSGTPMLGPKSNTVLKPIKKDPVNPFGADIRPEGQSEYFDSKGEVRLSAINKLKEEGKWDDMSRNLSSQFLSKQPLSAIKGQLNLTYKDYQQQYDEIMSLTNPTIKKKMLEDFATTCEGAASSLKAIAYPGQATKVILPVTSLKDNEVYAPTYDNGTELALVRFPHAGTFEIPIVKVNNRNKEAREILGNVRDAVGINARVAERLSGADFDGDTVVAIPTNNGKTNVKSTPALRELEGFDPKREYAKVPGMKIMSEDYKQKQMGIVSNLITDMTLAGAPMDEIARAVKHSMVVIDAPKHELDYQRSERENGINELKKKWQVHRDEDGNIVKSGGASTLISRRGTDIDVPERQGSGIINKETGEVTYKESGRYHFTEKGKFGKGYEDKATGKIRFKVNGKYEYYDKDDPRIKRATDKADIILETPDVRTLSSGTREEAAYADYANKMKALANSARKEMVSTKAIKYSPTAHDLYEREVSELESLINQAAMNAPRERRAVAIANSMVNAQKAANPELSTPAYKKELKKIRNNAMQNARTMVGASSKDRRFDVTDAQWAAIQSGAVRATTIEKVWRYANQDDLKKRALPKADAVDLTSKATKIRSMLAAGKTYAEIASALGVSTSTIVKYAN